MVRCNLGIIVSLALALCPAGALRPFSATVRYAIPPTLGALQRRSDDAFGALLSQRSRPALCAAAHELPPLLSLAKSNAWRVVFATLLITLDITFYTFPLPFIGDFLANTLRCSPQQIANLVASFTYSALAAGAAVVFVEGRRDAPRTQSRQCFSLALAAFVMASVAGAQAFRPTFNVLYIARLVQGAASQFAWATALAAAASLAPLAGVKATAWVMAGNSIGEVLGPLFGSKLYALGGIRFPFVVASALATLLAAGFSASGFAVKAISKPTRATQQPAGAPSATFAPLSPPPAAPVVRRQHQKGSPMALLDGFIPATSPIRDGPTLRLCTMLALSCGVVRSALDNLLPLFLRTHHAFSISQISNVMLCAALCFVCGSTASGYLLARMPSIVMPVLTAATLVTSLLSATVFLPPTGMAVSAIFCGYFALSAFVSIAAVSVLEERGRQLGNTDDVMALQVFFWTLGFALGGMLAVIASGGSASATRQRLVMGVAGGLNALYAMGCLIMDSSIKAESRTHS